MNTHDPDRCLASTTLVLHGAAVVLQCQSSIHHDGKHAYGEDHYTVRWDADEPAAA
jgi:hypothetical protein